MGKKIAILIAVVLVLLLGAAGGLWWWKQHASAASVAEQAAPRFDARQASYVTLDKVLVMLKSESQPGLRMQNTYISLDLVLRTDKLHEKAVKAELPMLKGVAVRTLSQLDLEQARAMSIDAWTELLSTDLEAAYAGQPDLQPFDKVMVSRLIIE
ncbi:hypothetical protein [Comamonas guangdongensis]|uniref:Flagellar protein FliL n=1 Tax=Comamonas guangdongensis TaxID=510515 RepID=A0ABV3ZSJ4_9BURK